MCWICSVIKALIELLCLCNKYPLNYIFDSSIYISHICIFDNDYQVSKYYLKNKTCFVVSIIWVTSDKYRFISLYKKDMKLNNEWVLMYLCEAYLLALWYCAYLLALWYCAYLRALWYCAYLLALTNLSFLIPWLLNQNYF